VGIKSIPSVIAAEAAFVYRLIDGKIKQELDAGR
jgi:hypothetical protein